MTEKQLSFEDIEKPKRKRRSKTEKALKEIEEKIIDVEYSDVMSKSYIDYSMSVITSRALPDVRDGLKPVQRRILYDMSELGVTHDKPYRKVARIVGDTMGKYHPHGDSSIGDALVVMAQDWKKGAVLIDGHGNFGSVEGDEPAAARYIECRMSEFSEDVLLSDLKLGTVDFVPNYDEQEKEPVILPCKLPNLLINGSEGIAVGMATNIPPHNAGETIDAAIYFMDHPGATTDDIMQFIQGPDFPTGGIISNRAVLKEVYETGSGKIKVRGKVEVEKEKGRERIVITEMPFTMIGDGINKFLQQVAGLVEDKTIPEISDISNQSSKDGIRIVLDLKKGADAENIVNILYKKTKLEDTFGYNLLAISDGKPETMSLLDVLRAFIDFQYEIYTRKFQTLLKKASQKKEIDEGLITAINAIDAVVEVVRGSKTVKIARDALMTGKVSEITFKTKESEKIAKGFRFTELQTDAIMALRLQRLVGLELEVLEEDLKKVLKNIKQYNKLLKSKAEMRRHIQGEMGELKKKYDRPRRTKLVDAKEIVIAERPEEVLPVTVLVDRFHYIRALDPALYEKNSDSLSSDDKRYVIQSDTASKIIAFTEEGKAHTIKVRDIPYVKMRDKGVPIDNISGYDSKHEKIVSILPLREGEWVFASSNGLVKRVDSMAFDVTRKTVAATKLAPDTVLVGVVPFGTKTVTLNTEKGYCLSFRQTEIPVQGINARGAVGIKLVAGDSLKNISATNEAKYAKRAGRGKR